MAVWTVHCGWIRGGWRGGTVEGMTALSHALPTHTVPSHALPTHPFPGRWLGGASLVLGPVLLLAGVLTRFGPDFFFPAQLSAYAAEPTRMSVAYGLFAAGHLLLCPAVLALANRIGGRWAGLGATMVLAGLFARTFHAGSDNLAFRLADAQGPHAAAEVVAGSYPVPHLFTYLSFAIMFGWPVLAFAAYRARVLGPLAALAMAAATTLPIGVLKGSTTFSVIAAAGLCLALIPLGLRVLGAGPRPEGRAWLRFAALAIGALALGWLSTFG